MADRATPARLRFLALMMIAAVLIVIGFFAIGRGYGLKALGTGRNPFALTQPTPERVAKSREHGDRLIQALDRFKQEHARYPAALEDPPPDRVRAIEPPLVGDRCWRYRVTPDGGYELSFFVGPIYERDFYESAKGAWSIDR